MPSKKTKRRSAKLLDMMESMFPNANTELVFSNLYELLIAVMLSAQTKDHSVNQVTPKLFSRFPGPRQMMNADPEEVEKIISSLGLQRTKSKRIIELSRIIIADHNGSVPEDQDKLESLPGIGRKTASVVLSLWNSTPRLAVDTHVQRVAKRLKMVYKKDTVLMTERKLNEIVDPKQWIKAHYLMLHFGRYHCTAKAPKCEGCPFKSECVFPHHMFDKKG